MNRYYFQFNEQSQLKFNVAAFVVIESNQRAVEGAGRYVRLADKAWREGPKGGVKLIKNRYDTFRTYITTNPELMKEFMWAKLSAVPV